MGIVPFGGYQVETRYEILPPDIHADIGSKQVAEKLLTKLCSGATESMVALAPLWGILLQSDISYGNQYVSFFGPIYR